MASREGGEEEEEREEKRRKKNDGGKPAGSEGAQERSGEGVREQMRAEPCRILQRVGRFDEA